MNRVSAPEYDRFKVIVTFILVVILLLMLLRGCATPPAPLPTQTLVPTVISPTLKPSIAPPTASGTAVITKTMTALPDSQTSTLKAPATTTTPILDLSATSPALTATVVTVTPTLTTTPTQVIEITATQPAATPTQTAAPPPVTTTATPDTSCKTVLPSQLQVGQKAVIKARLNLRQQPAITAPRILTNPIGTQVDVVDGPICTPIGNNRAYLWWNIRLADGTTGWSAEMPLFESHYFMEPVQ